MGHPQGVEGLRVEVGDLCGFAQRTTTVAENGWRTQWQISSCMADLHWHFVPDNGEGSVVTEDEELRDVEMEESGTDMADNTMNEILH